MDINELEKWLETAQGAGWIESKKAPLVHKRDELLATLRETNGRLAEQAQRAADVEKLLSDEREATRKVIVDDALTRHLKNYRVMEHAIPGIVTELKEAYALEMETDGSNRKAIGTIRDENGERKATLETIVQRWAEMPTSKHVIKASDASGGGALGGSGAGSLQNIPLSQFNQMNPADRLAFTRSGGTITD